jgi:hypothetical protein
LSSASRSGRGRSRVLGWFTRDTYDNAMAETVNGRFKTELIRRQGPWRSLERCAAGLPDASTWIAPALACVLVQVIEGGLHHARVEQQAFDSVTIPVSTGVGRLSADPEVIAADFEHAYR